MALPSSGVLEVRSGGSSTAGGGFNPLRVGATQDYSQQDAVQQAYTDLVIDAANATLISSVAFPFTSLAIGNFIRQTGGVGFTTGVFEITAVDGSSRAVLDRSAGTLGSTGGTGNLGGALDTLPNAVTITVPGNVIWVRASSGYTSAATITLSVDRGDGTPVRVEGYTTTRGDNGQAVITSTNAAATSLINITGNGTILKNITADGAGLSLRAINVSDLQVTVDNCWAKGATQYGFRAVVAQAMFRRCLATGNGTSGAHAGFAADTAHAIFDRCVSRNNAGNGFSSVNAGTLTALNCLAHENALSGFGSHGGTSEVHLVNCTSYGNTLDGLRFAAASTWENTSVRNSIFAGNAGYGMRSITTDYSGVSSWIVQLESNAFFNNALGARFQVPTGAADITLSLDPFTDAANDDFSLNLTEGGGLALRATGVPGGFGLRSSPEPSVAFTDVGAVTASGSVSASSSLGFMRNLWRELTGEKYQDVVPPAVVDLYIQRGCEWLNQALEYHHTTDAAGVTLVAGVQEYTLDEDVMRVKWVYWNGHQLERGDIEEWRNRHEAWRQEPEGFPEQWAVEGNRIIFRPTPSAAAVAAASAPVIRYVSNPPDIGIAGPEQLQSQDWRLPVYYGAHLWSVAYPDSALAVQRSEGLLARSREEGSFSQRDAGAKDTRK